MNRQKENLKAVAGEMSKLGMEIPRDVELAIEELENPVYKVAVVGKLQQGQAARGVECEHPFAFVATLSGFFGSNGDV